MRNKKIYLFISLFLLLLLVWQVIDLTKTNKDQSVVVKIALREVGHQLLLANNDATSIVLPVVAMEKSKYQISFQKDLTIDPTNLVDIVQESFHKASLTKHYLVEVISCAAKEVVYSYEVKNINGKDIIPCRGRVLPKSCYTITIYFTNNNTYSFRNTYVLIFINILALLLFQLLFFKKEKRENVQGRSEEKELIGSFVFYPKQNKLVKEAIEISLSKKECELLAIFIAKPNQIIKREELTKKVWEDHGVIVGRSLDTYISKLRKKLKIDTTIKLLNIHGVGYKLEVNKDVI